MLEQFWRWGGAQSPDEQPPGLLLVRQQGPQTDYGKTRNRYKLVSGALTVRLDVTIDKMDIHEVIEVERNWDSAVREYLTYTMDYEEPHIFETHERERMKTLSGGDWCFKAHLKIEGRDRYLSNEMYVDNMHILSPSKCMLSYESTRLSRGLRSLAQLKMPPHTTDAQAKNEVFPFLFAEMLKKGEGLLINQLGEDRSKWKTALHRGRLSHLDRRPLSG